MNRQRFSLLALAGIAILVAGAAAAQTPPPAAPPATPAARPRLLAPVRGVAQLGYTKPVVKQGKIDGREFVITTIRVKNMAAGPIAGLKVDEFWYDKAGNPVTGDNYRHTKPLLPGEVITITLETPRDPRMNRNQYNFTHANGEIKATLQP
ncbi:MAG: hypothetical protein EXQ53_08775, partial [Acidobacteria bacterium]|nr:hypothetical protein [Acidobacteriota bacterium]